MNHRYFFVALAIILFCPFASAQWVQTNGPYGGYVYCFAVSGTNLFAEAYRGGVWRRPLSEMVTSVERLSTDLPTQFLRQHYARLMCDRPRDDIWQKSLSRCLQQAIDCHRRPSLTLLCSSCVGVPGTVEEVLSGRVKFF